MEDHYAEVAELRLQADVPSDVQIAFDTSLNALLYSWFVYRFHQVAELQALSAVELGLRRRLHVVDQKRGPRLGRLLESALARNLIRGEGFRQYRRIVSGDTWPHRLGLSAGAVGQSVDPPPPREYAKVVVKFL